MSLLALAAWIITAGGGLYLLSIWLIEYDKDFHSVAATRLPPAVLASHVTLAGGGLLVWIGYVIIDSDPLAWTAVAALGMAATLGTVMAVRWVGVYRAARAAVWARRLAPQLSQAGGKGWGSAESRVGVHGRGAVLAPSVDAGPPERNFPLPVVIAHGAFAAVTITLVLLTAFGVGSS